MNKFAIALLSFIYILCQHLNADDVSIIYPESAAKAFGKERQLSAKIVRKDGEIRLEITNVSPKHIAITKEPHMGTTQFLKSDGSKLGKSGFTHPGEPMEYFNHVVLPPKRIEPEGLDWSTYTVCKFPSKRKGTSAIEFHRTMGGYFPSIDQYVEFWIEGKVSMKDEEGEQAGAGQPATKPADTPPVKDQPSTPTSKDGPQ